jgi:hypothetical protein
MKFHRKSKFEVSVISIAQECHKQQKILQSLSLELDNSKLQLGEID